jgi:hypothetical protein
MLERTTPKAVGAWIPLHRREGFIEILIEGPESVHYFVHYDEILSKVFSPGMGVEIPKASVNSSCRPGSRRSP